VLRSTSGEVKIDSCPVKDNLLESKTNCFTHQNNLFYLPKQLVLVCKKLSFTILLMIDSLSEGNLLPSERSLSELTGEVELDVLEVLLRHAQHVTAVCKEDITPLQVRCHILIFTLLEVVIFLFVVALNPACLVEMYWFPTAFGVVFIFQAVLDDLKLQLSDRSDDSPIVELIDEQLGYTFIHQLLDAFIELLRLHRVVVFDILEKLWRETRKTTEMDFLALGERVANLENAVVGQSDNVSRISFFYR
jgi:hypothetical protein